MNPVITLLLSLHWVTVATESIAEDLTNLQFYFRTFHDQSRRSVDVSKALTAAGSQARYLAMESERSTPITSVVP
ncbi:MAG TPA: hypothetical protein VHX17_13225 [Candidatus Cybelea sp.]|nr:hypothetical protein [Candidatus Cybelea sp.]